MSAGASRGFATALFAALVAGCGGGDDGTGLSGTVVDPTTGSPLPGALVAIEEGGLYRPNPNPAKGNPSYQYGTRAGDDGSFQIELPPGDKGVHVFANGYRYWPSNKTVNDGETTDVQATPEHDLPEDMRPTLSMPAFTPASVGPGGATKLSVTAKAGDAMKAPLSDEILVLLPEKSFGRELDPPSAGQPGVAYPDGVYSIAIVAPSDPGSYTYYIVASAENCVVADVVTAVLTVK